MSSRLAIGLGLAFFMVAAAAVVLFTLGTPAAPASAGAPAAPAVGGATAQSAVISAPEADGDVPLAIEVPGCVCHSDDPALVAEHAQYRMNQCFDCHADGMPAMGR